jgi:hypothetical protein
VSGTKRSRGATGTPDILHHKFLTKMTAKDVSDDPACDIGRPAGGKGNDDRDRSRGIILGLCAVHSDRHEKKGRCYQMLCHLSAP